MKALRLNMRMITVTFILKNEVSFETGGSVIGLYRFK